MRFPLMEIRPHTDTSPAEPAPADQLEHAGRLLGSAAWTFAKSMPHIPHWWTVRAGWNDRGLDDEFVWVWRFIKQYGVIERYPPTAWGFPYRVLHVGGALEFMQEIEPDTWSKVTDRIASTNSVARMRESYKPPAELPHMFTTWREYRDHLLENLIEVPEVRERFRANFGRWDKVFRVEDPEVELGLMKMEIASLLVNDFEGTKYSTFMASHPRWSRKWRTRVRQMGDHPEGDQ